MSETQVPAYFDRGPVQLWTARPNGELDYVNGAVLDYFGRSREEMLAWGWAELVHPDDLEHVGERWSDSIESGTPYRVEFRLRRHDGLYLWHLARAEARLDPHGDIVRWLGANIRIDEPTF